MNKFYRVRVTRFGLPAFVIATAFQTIGEFYGEIFCVFPEPHSRLEFKIIKADRNSFEEAKVALTEEFMMKEVLNQAEISFSRHIQLVVGSSKRTTLGSRSVIRARAMICLSRAWSRDGRPPWAPMSCRSPTRPASPSTCAW